MDICGRQSKGHGRTVCHRGGGHFRPGSPKAWPYSAGTKDFTNFEVAALLHAALLLVVGSRYFLKGGQWAFSADSPKDMAVQCATAVVAIFGLVVQRHSRTVQPPGTLQTLKQRPCCMQRCCSLLVHGIFSRGASGHFRPESPKDMAVQCATMVGQFRSGSPPRPMHNTY